METVMLNTVHTATAMSLYTTLPKEKTSVVNKRRLNNQGGIHFFLLRAGLSYGG